MGIAEENSIENYIASLLGHTLSPCPDRKVPGGPISDNSEMLTEPCDNSSAQYDSFSDDSYHKFLSFDVCSISYIVPVVEVLTVRRYSHGDCPDSTLFLDPACVSGHGNSSPAERKFVIYLNAYPENAILSDTVNGVVSLAGSEIRGHMADRSHATSKGIGRNSRYVLLDSGVLAHLHNNPANSMTLA